MSHLQHKEWDDKTGPAKYNTKVKRMHNTDGRLDLTSLNNRRILWVWMTAFTTSFTRHGSKMMYDHDSCVFVHLKGSSRSSLCTSNWYDFKPFAWRERSVFPIIFFFAPFKSGWSVHSEEFLIRFCLPGCLCDCVMRSQRSWQVSAN